MGTCTASGVTGSKNIFEQSLAPSLNDLYGAHIRAIRDSPMKNGLWPSRTTHFSIRSRLGTYRAGLQPTIVGRPISPVWWHNKPFSFCEANRIWITGSKLPIYSPIRTIASWLELNVMRNRTFFEVLTMSD